MKEIKIKIPDKCGKSCICFEEASTDRKTTYSICRAFNRVLTLKVNDFGTVMSIERCEECQHFLEELSPKNTTEGESK